MSPAALIEPISTTLPESSSSASSSPERADLDNNLRFGDLRGVQWRINLGILPSLPSSSVDDLRRVTANTRRSYASLRRRLLIDTHIPKDGSNFPDLVMDNPLSQNPDSMWGRFFQKAELEKMVDQDLSRLYPEHGSYFQTSGCQEVLRRILLLWCIRHPKYGYRQGMHELVAPLLYVLQADIERFSEVRKLYEDYFADNFDGLSFHETDYAYNSNYKQVTQHTGYDTGIQKDQITVNNFNGLDPKIQTIISFSDAYGAEGELGIVSSQKFIEHDAYCMFAALMNGSGGAVAMADFFSLSPQNGLPPIIEASSALYHLLSIVDSSLYTHLVELGVEPQYFALRWLRVLFGREFSLDDLLIIWDEIFAFDNSKLNEVSEKDSEFSFGVLNSSRGAFISALAVSMILYLRSSVLATENATACLQRLLNFPEDVNLRQLIKKAKSLLAIAIDAIKSTPHPLLPALGSPPSLVPHSYWEEKWRVLHKEEEEQKLLSPHKPFQNHIKGWSQKVKLRLSRKSDPSSSKVDHEKINSSRLPLGRNVVEDQAHSEKDNEKRLSGIGGSGDNSLFSSDPPSPRGIINNNDDQENDTERSSVASNLSVDVSEPELSPAEEICSSIQEVASSLPASDASEGSCLEVMHNKDTQENSGPNLKDRKPLSGKFQWFRKFGKIGVEGSSEKRGSTPEAIGSSIVECDKNSADSAASTADGASKAETVDQNRTCSLKHLGQSMLENIQVIESFIQPEKALNGSIDNFSKNALVGRGQGSAMAALKELRKVSNVLSEM